MTGFAPLAALDGRLLLAFAELLEADLLPPAASALALRDHIPEPLAHTLADWLAELAQRDLTPAQIGLLLRAFAAGREAAPQNAPTPVDVVVSGPDATGRARDTGVVMRELFWKARKRVLAVGFAVHQGKSVFGTLADRLDGDKSLEATLCLDVRRPHGDTSLDREIVHRFADEFLRVQWPGDRLPRVYYDPRSVTATGSATSALHAKCVVIDGREALVTSANFTEAAQDRNIELGLLVGSRIITERVEEHFMSLIRKGLLQRLPLAR